MLGRKFKSVLTVTEIQEHLVRVTYKPGWTFECYEDVVYNAPSVRICALVPDVNNPEETVTVVQKSICPYLVTVEEFDRWMIFRLEEMERRELREFYRVDGAPVDDPHKRESKEVYCESCGIRHEPPIHNESAL